MLQTPLALPDSFFLVLSKNTGVRRQCEIVWQADSSAGIRFVRSQPIRKDASYFADAISRLRLRAEDKAMDSKIAMELTELNGTKP